MCTWSPERYPPDTEVAATFFVVNTYLTLIEQLVRDGRSEREIEQIVKQTVREDVEALESELDELPDAA